MGKLIAWKAWEVFLRTWQHHSFGEISSSFFKFKIEMRNYCENCQLDLNIMSYFFQMCIWDLKQVIKNTGGLGIFHKNM